MSQLTEYEQRMIDEADRCTKHELRWRERLVYTRKQIERGEISSEGAWFMIEMCERNITFWQQQRQTFLEAAEAGPPRRPWWRFWATR